MSSRGWAVVLGSLWLWGLGGSAFATPRVPQRWTVASVEALAKGLRHAEAAQRLEAFDRLRQAPSAAFAALRARARTFEDASAELTQRLSRQEASFRHALKLFRADVYDDIAPGARLRLEASAEVAEAAERLALVRALEADRVHPEALSVAFELLLRSPKAFGWEIARVARRAGVRAAPVLYSWVGHKQRLKRMRAERLLAVAGLSSPAAALQAAAGAGVPLHVLRDLIRVLGERRTIAVMEDLRGYLDDPRPSVRQAAWEAVEHFHGDFIWQYRKAFEHLLDEAAPAEGDWQVLRQTLKQRLEARSQGPLLEAIGAAEHLRAQGELAAMHRSLEIVWRESPAALPEAFAAAYVDLAAGAQDAGERAVAAAHFERAAWIETLHGQPDEARRHRAEAAALHADEDALAGQVDAMRYWAAALDGAPSAEARLDAWLAAGRAKGPPRGLFVLLALVLLALGVILQRRRLGAQGPEHDAPPTE